MILLLIALAGIACILMLSLRKMKPVRVRK